MSELSPEDKSVDAIRAEITRLTLELEAAERRKILEAATIVFSKPIISNNMLSIHVHPIREDFRILIEDMGSKVADGMIKIDPEYWNIAVYDKVNTLPNIKWDFSDSEKSLIKNWKPAPHVLVKYDSGKQSVLFDLLISVPTAPIYATNIPTFRADLGKYSLNVSSLYMLREILNGYDKLTTIKGNKIIVSVADDVMADLINEENRRDAIAKIVTGDGSDLTPVFLNGIRGRNFQLQALEFFKHTEGNGILALDMGLGKTWVSLAYIEWYHTNINAKQKFIICVPASLRPNWSHEIIKYLPNEKVYHLTGREPTSLDVQHLLTRTDYRVFLINYDSIAGRFNHEETTGNKKAVFPWSAIITMAKLKLICDEAHYIKNTSSARSQVILQTTFLSSMMLTGTPMKNGPLELYPLVRKVKPDLAGSASSWETTYTYDKGKRARDPVRLRKVLEPIMFRRLKSEVIKDLPPINRIMISYELSDIAKKAYNDILLGFYKQIKDWNGDTSDSKAVQNMLVELMRMKQTCSEDKIDFTADLAISLNESDESEYNKVIVFSQFANSPEVVKRIAQKLGHEALYFTGNNDVYERQRLVDQFQNDSNIKYLCCATKSAGEGLNITAAGHVIFVDLMWTPGDHAQAEGRAYGRLSNLHTITSNYIIAENTVEDHIIGILSRKFEQIANIVDGKEIDGGSIVGELLGKLRNLNLLK